MIDEIINKNINEVKILNLLNESKNVVIITHMNPDGDAAGSATALAYYLLSAEKSVNILVTGEYPSNLEFLNQHNLIQSFDPKDHNEIINSADLICIVDLNDPDRFKEMKELVLASKAIKVVIDHHIKPKEFADNYCIDSKATSTGELIWRILKNDSSFQLNKNIATALYTAIMTDTGSFRFPKTNSTTHRIIADLIDAGADPVSIYDSVYNQFPVSSARLKGIGYANLELYHEKRVCLMTISQKDFQITGAKEEETEGFVESLLAIQDVKVGILLIDSPKSNQIRCSFRAKADAEVRSLAEKFNGGGHAQAAGARVSGMSLEELKKVIIIESGLLFS